MKSVQNLEQRLKKIEKIRRAPGIKDILLVDSSEPGHQDRLREHHEYIHDRYPGFTGISAIVLNQVFRDDNDQ